MLSEAQSGFVSMSQAHAEVLAHAQAEDQEKTASLLHAALELEGLQGHLVKAGKKQAENEAALEEQKATQRQPKPIPNNSIYSLLLFINSDPI